MSAASSSTMPLQESAPLLGIKRLTPAWGIWHATSPGHRFFLLFFICLIPFGGHFVKNQMSSLEQLMLDDKAFPLTNTMYGALNSAVSIPNMIIPFFGGHLLDSRGHLSILWFVLLMCVGQALFTFAMSAHVFWLAMVGRVIFGIGEGSVVAGARAILSFWFDHSELTCAMGIMVAITNVSKMLAKSTSAPLALHFGSYTYGLAYGVVVCVVCSGFALVVVRSTLRLKKLRKAIRRHQRMDDRMTDMATLIDPSLTWLTTYCRSSSSSHSSKPAKLTRHVPLGDGSIWASVADFSIVFWLVVVVHVLFINAFHLFQNISSSYLYQVHGYSIVHAGMLSSLSHVFVLVAPFVGLFIDYVGGRMIVVIASCVVGVVAYSLLVFTATSPVVSMLLFSVCLAATPTILMASIPLSISKHRFGLAFGLVEVIDGLGAFLGNLGIGYLRDTTGSFDAVMYLLFAITSLTLVLSLVLAYVDTLYGGNLSSATVNIPDSPPSSSPTSPDELSSSSEDCLPSKIYL
ncbi:Aste57867_25247 [Aphanomyces stellatus]|uniref:Lysosomal dipeptide transporter MFSD1 n=1 Tax=Aphanomyces stellatus TaxID=120398 RepID=A0A485LX91_9STRA|nr:hypothetical protein As57867_025169 [Aphanomyces stellatus]VFU01873.1 Aste57867_25247 [Aphanomyces stellatus]